MKYTLGEAAKVTGKSKATISKYLKSGKLSYLSKTASGYQIDASELQRVFPKSEHTKRSSERSQTQESTHETRVLTAKLEAEIEVLKVKWEAERKRADNLESERDDWRDQAKKLLIEAPRTPVEQRKRFLGIF